MKWQYNVQKSQANKEKNGIDFPDAQQLWSDPNRIEIPARTEDEPRYLLIGKIEQKHWSAIFTPRPHGLGLISVRRSRKEEVRLYEG